MSPDASRLRAQAEIYFELARQMSLPADAEVFRQAAEEFRTRASRLDDADAASSPASKKLAERIGAGFTEH